MINKTFPATGSAMLQLAMFINAKIGEAYYRGLNDSLRRDIVRFDVKLLADNRPALELDDDEPEPMQGGAPC